MKLRVWFYQTIVNYIVLTTMLKILKFTYFFWRHRLYLWKVGWTRTALEFLLHLTTWYVVSLLIASTPTCNAFHSSCWILYRSSQWLTETDFCSILKISLHHPQNKQKEWTAVSVNSSCFYSTEYLLPFCDHKATLSRRWQLFRVSICSRTCTWGIHYQECK